MGNTNGKLSGLQSSGTNLQVRSNNSSRQSCRSNTITAIGYGNGMGSGDIREVLEDGRVNTGYYYNQPNMQFFLKRHFLQSYFNFNYFKRMVICKDQPWICEKYI